MAFKELGVIEELYYDGPIAQVVAMRDPGGQARVEIRLVEGRHTENNEFCGDYVSISPTLEVLRQWAEKAEELNKAVE